MEEARFSEDLFTDYVYIGRLQSGGRLEAPRRLTSDGRGNLVYAWTLDSKSVVFVSDRTGVSTLYRQEIDQELAELIPTGPEQVGVSRVTPDGSSIVYLATGVGVGLRDFDGRPRIMRVPISGGPRELLMDFPPSGYLALDCPIRASAECVVEDRPAGTNVDQARFIAFDPLTKKQRELFRGIGGLMWTLSPDGAHISRIRGNNIGTTTTLSGNNVDVLSLAGQIEQTIQLISLPLPG